MPFCSECGTKLGDGAKFCPNCGKPVAQAAAKEVKVTEAAKPQGVSTIGKTAEVCTVEVKEAPQQQATFAQKVTIEKCHGCGKPFELANAKVAFGHKYHNECFKCHVCHQRLFSFAKFYEDNGEIICHQCMLKNVPKCAKCGKPLTGGYIEYMDKNWHKECVPPE